MTSDLTAETGRPPPPPPDPAEARRIGMDSGALERLYRAHLDDVLAYLSRRCTDPHDVADLVAETFLVAIDSAGRYDPRRGRPVAWLIGIARHVFLRHVRDVATARRAAVRIEGRRLLDEEDVATLEDRIDAERLAQRVLGNLSALTTRERELVELVDLAGLTPAEAAATLHIPAGVARVRLHRAHTRLKKLGNPDG